MELDFNARFKNWIAWCQMRGLFQSRTGSAEGLWRSPQVFEDRLPRPVWLLEMDEPDAIALNRVYTALARFQPAQARAIKVIWFKTHWRPSWQAQAIRCRTIDLPARAYQAKTAFSNLLTMRETKYLILDVAHNSSIYGETLLAA